MIESLKKKMESKDMQMAVKTKHEMGMNRQKLIAI